MRLYKVIIFVGILTTLAIVLGLHRIGYEYGYKQGFEAGIKYDKQMRKQAHDSIIANCKWNNGVPATAVATNDSVLQENFPKPNMNKLLRGE